MNLFDLINGHLTDDVIDRVAHHLGESSESTRRALSGGSVPALLAGLANNFGSSENGAGRLLDLVSAGKHDGGLLADLGAALGGGAQTDAVLNTGKSLMGTILGSRADAVADLLTSFAGIRRSSAATLLGMSVPVILGVIGKQVKSSGLNAAGLLGSLGAVKSMLGGIAPPGLGAALGQADPVSPVVSPAAIGAPTAADSAAPEPVIATPATPLPLEPQPAGKRGSMIPWIIVPVATLLFAYGLRTCQERNPNAPARPATEPATPLPAAVAPPAEPAATEPAPAPITDSAAEPTPAAAPPVVELTGGAQSATGQLLAYLRDGADTALPRSFVLDELKFAVGTAEIDSASQQTLGDVATILNAFPTTRIELQGHTDDRGDAARNKTLSQARADAVRNSLLALGIAAERLTAVGFGSDKPLASNDTDAGRSQNRRTELVVVAK